jgi:dTDP-4-amino-4,6-dideoxygalactose transaminase
MVPNISDAAIDAVAEVLRSGMLVQGKNVEALENEIAEYLGVEHAVAVSNGTATLHLALLTAGIGPGDEVIVPALSYVATANVVEVVGAKCVFVDVEKETFNIDATKIEAAITPRTKAIIPVHEFGLACDIQKIVELAQRFGLFVIEDAACALGATDNGRFAGTVGQVGSFSLHPRKAVTSGEGGILTTNDAATARQYKTLRNHGIDPKDGKNDFVAAGLNYRMTDFQAALVRPQFKDLNAVISRRNEIAELYHKHLSDEPKITLPITPPGKFHTWQTFHVLLDESIDRDGLIERLKNEGIGTNLGAQCIPAQTYYARKYGIDCKKHFPNALSAFQSGLALPMFDQLTDEQVLYVSTILRKLL